MAQADGLSASLEITGPQISGSEVSGQNEQLKGSDRKPANLRGRCALLLLVAIAVIGYGAMFYLGQRYLVN
ncbi:hypothetical protein [Pelagibius sp. Alg239-R121]|uniref:hypothetical protein n=1 Tax=Pelagibius sp. Alg239-R121 TaxID=2993448 RepID=UPI0024A7A0A4|nr:hypothetical protein [Pelagibius sp. Alg239-R121]